MLIVLYSQSKDYSTHDKMVVEYRFGKWKFEIRVALMSDTHTKLTKEKTFF